MKRKKIVFISIILTILLVIVDWYSDFLFSYLWLGFIPIVIVPVIAVIIGWLILIILNLIKNHTTFIDFLPLVFLILSLFILIIVPTRIVKANVEVYLLENARLNLIDEIYSGKLDIDENCNVDLKGLQKFLSTGDVTIYAINDDKVVAFWVLRVPAGAPIQVVYSEKGMNSVVDIIGSDNIFKIKELKDDWYYVVWKE